MSRILGHVANTWPHTKVVRLNYKYKPKKIQMLIAAYLVYVPDTMIPTIIKDRRSNLRQGAQASGSFPGHRMLGDVGEC